MEQIFISILTVINLLIIINGIEGLLSKLFKNAYDIKHHYKSYHYNIPFQKLKTLIYPRKVLNEIKCEYCEKQFSTNELLEKHLIKKSNFILLYFFQFVSWRSKLNF